ncbi:hypothetical protein HYN56_09840 [Flavobacterium crocinum]|uniref:DUF3592 domain-containing protein n=1 Tax=Flavobacterium crocinum TaxID=2183896 RepID=A0A2S1YKI6_9FLAO|nr:hypothetical protein [Flavobacterium crocinum]AWK04516.1 hypothetical protein HYN56_09840 [Flavobacterium crocinum]
MNNNRNKKNINPISQEKTTVKDYFKLGVILAIIILFFVWIGVYLIEEKSDEVQYIREDYTITKGIITDITLYKGKSVTVKYLVNGKIYKESDGIDKKMTKVRGDSINIKYSNKKPELMISEYNWDY